MLAVIKTNGKQYLIKENDVFKIEKIEGNVGKVFYFDKVLLLFDEKKGKINLGKPILKKVKVKTEILEQGKNKKIFIIKYKPKTRYRRKRGFRQPYTKVKIAEIIVEK